MTKIDIFSGFLGAGKTTLIKKLLQEVYAGQKIVLIENEFGEIGIDGGFLQEADIQITEMNSGCICCSLVGDFGEALKKVMEEYHPDRILIEPSGVGKLSDVAQAVEKAETDEMEIGCMVAVADATKCKIYMKNFGEFYNNQIENAGTIILSRTDGMKEDKLQTAVSMLREKNPNAVIVTTPWDQLTGAQLMEAMEQKDSLAAALAALERHGGEECDDPECSCHHHHDHDHEHEHHHDHDHDHDHEHEHHHDHEHEHHHDHEHEHHHDHDHDHDHDHHHHHHADEVFTSWGMETPKKFTAEKIAQCLAALEDQETYGMILRAKGIVAGEDGQWVHFDYVPGEPDIRTGSAGVIGRLCVIGSKINEAAIAALFA
ncbi:MAG: GTP-binding protein [Oscillospiraceae bacterium]|nr:GTP-binding protein [Oscillospiraceae bacterium]